MQHKLAALEAQKATEDTAGGKDPSSVTPEQIAEIVGRWTSIPVTRLMSSEKDKLLKLEKLLAASVVGQPEAVKAVANAIRLSRSGLANAQRPIASFLLAGPSGTGKTLLSKTVSLLFISAAHLIK
jgi:ATP-dependent Clp protease ATP-binding subunit ClpB